MRYLYSSSTDFIADGKNSRILGELTQVKEQRGYENFVELKSAERGW